MGSKIGMSPDMHHGEHDCHHGRGQCKGFADAIISRLSHSNPVLVVSEHEHIQYILEGLGMSSSSIPHWSNSDYDSVYVVEFFAGQISFTHSHQGRFTDVGAL